MPDDENDDDDSMIAVKNAFYEAEADLKTQPKKALEKFIECYKLEESLKDEVQYSFQALKHIVIIYCGLGDAF